MVDSNALLHFHDRLTCTHHTVVYVYGLLRLFIGSHAVFPELGHKKFSVYVGYRKTYNNYEA